MFDSYDDEHTEYTNYTNTNSIVESPKTPSHHFCNNCGYNGHYSYQCKYPITSIGIIPCIIDIDPSKEKDISIRYLLICRRDTLGYVEFIRGKYPLYNERYLQNIIDEMTLEEKERLKTDDFHELWMKLWGNRMGNHYRNEEITSQRKFNALKRGVFFNTSSIIRTLDDFIQNSKTKWTEQEWGFPKGRRNHQERDMMCALREFEEETGYNSSNITIIHNLQPFEEIFTGSNYKSYKHCYYLGIVKNTECLSMDITKKPFQKSEVSALKWLTYEEACEKIRPYNIEKLKMLYQIDTLLKEKHTMFYSI
jgi:8-oxo-dGTP pyrophosphatase MutT (NUDIX family)